MDALVPDRDGERRRRWRDIVRQNLPVALHVLQCTFSNHHGLQDQIFQWECAPAVGQQHFRPGQLVRSTTCTLSAAARSTTMSRTSLCSSPHATSPCSSPTATPAMTTMASRMAFSLVLAYEATQTGHLAGRLPTIPTAGDFSTSQTQFFKCEEADAVTVMTISPRF